MKNYHKFNAWVQRNLKDVIIVEGYKKGIDKRKFTESFLERSVNNLVNDMNKKLKGHARDMRKFVEYFKDDEKSNLVRLFIWMDTLKIFEINNNIKNLLMLTTAPKKNSDYILPFEEIFIDVNFTKEQVKHFTDLDIECDEVIGIIVSETTVEEKDIGKKARMFLIEALIRRGKKYSRNVFAGNLEINVDMYDMKTSESVWRMEGERHKGERKHLNKFLHEFVLNFMNLLQDPDIVVRSVKTRRNKKHYYTTPPFYPRNIVRLDGRLKIYVDKVKERGLWEHNHSYWVMGHWRTLRHPRYGDNVGKRIWIEAYIKGEGVLIDKRYQFPKKGE